MDIAREAKQEYEKGTDLKTIRQLVDAKYGANGVNSTPTPFPN